MTRLYNLYGLAGQSNAIGNNGGGAPNVVNGYGFTTVTIRLNDDQSCAHQFSNTFYEGQSTKTPMIVIEGISGSSVTNSTANNWSATGALRGDLKTKLDNAITYLSKSDADGLIWMQGEADAQLIDAATITRAQFKTALQDLVDWWVTNYPTAPFLIVRTGRETTGDTTGYQDVREVQQEIADENAEVYMAYTGTINFTDLGLMEDSVHYSQVGQNLVGENVAQFIINNGLL